MKKMFKRRFSVVLAAVMVLSSLWFSTTAGAAPSESNAASAQSYNLPDKIEDGAILHCWTWNFKNIKANLSQIAQAGFKAIQTSPINAVKIGDGGKMSLKSTNKGNWWYQYQPTDYTIGNYMLGTEDEFKDMCNEAHKYGIKVIVDIVANHCSSDYSVISSHVKNIGGKAFHDRLEISDWSNRYQVTQGKLTGLYDLNTQNPAVQQMIVDYVTAVLSDGADGFRYDAAKHVELPDDDSKYGSDFWPIVLNNSAEFQDGEILSGGDRMGAYAKIMHVTAEGYGSNLQKAISKNTLSVAAIKNYRAYDEDMSDLDSKRLVTWVESHDNFCKDSNSTWEILDDKQIQQGWAVIAAQGDTTPLFFARPQGSNADSRWGDNTIGLAGNGNYYSSEVVEVNKFRNAMVGESKNIVQVVKNKVNMIERGNKGVVLVSVSDNENNVKVNTSLADGEYTDRVSGDKFTVTDGKLTGKIAAGEVVVLYNDDEPEVLAGDLNGNGYIDVEDATILQRFLAEFKKADGNPIVDVNDPKEFKIADANGDKKIDIQDVTTIQKIIAEFKI